MPSAYINDNRLLADFAAERDALLRLLTRTLEADDRVAAAWLWGSFGRGEADALSDLDVWVVVHDAAWPAVREGRHTFVRSLGEPLIALEAYGNWPVGGSYLLTLYSGESAPLHVDWYWQATSVAQVPPGTALLLDRVGLPHTATAPAFPGAPSTPQRTQPEEIAHQVRFFWAMLLIAAKYVGRAPARRGIELWDHVWSPLAAVQTLAGLAPPTLQCETGQVVSRFGDKLTLLRKLVALMATWMPQLAALGVETPSGCVVSQASKYLDMIDVIGSKASQP